MRSLKFRAWNKKLQEMGTFNFEDIIDCVLKFPSGIYEAIHEDLIIMQYLGEDCKDETGKEICEGDIVAHHKSKEIREVVYFEGGFGLKDEEGTLYTSEWGLYKIMGNIYQTPELLTENKSCGN